MLKLIFSPEHGFEGDAARRIAAMLGERPQLPPIPAVSRARLPQLCANYCGRTAWASPAMESVVCDECRVEQLKTGELDEDLAERAKQPAVF